MRRLDVRGTQALRPCTHSAVCSAGSETARPEVPRQASSPTLSRNEGRPKATAADESGIAPAKLGDYKSSVNAIGLQIGHFFPVGGAPWYVNLKAYKEFDAKHRPEGWNMWVSLLIPLGSEKK